MPLGLDIIHAALGGLSLLLLLILVARRRPSDEPLKKELAGLQRTLAELRGKPLEQEFRIERYELLWYPVVTYSPPEKKVLKITVGIPHCPKCCVAMKGLDEKVWGCPQCKTTCPASVTDLSVMDSIEKLARGYFLERRPDYR
ncbi:MAG: hypothetical protein ABIJ96_03620 [Elusimicrobiota bacterium]